MFEVTTRLEVNITDAVSARAEINNLSSFLIKNKIPVVVATPDLIETLIYERNKLFAKYKIICAVDYPHGKAFAVNKVYNLPKTCLLADGYDITLSAGKTDIECRNELQSLNDFFRQIDGAKEIRYSLALRSRKPEDVVFFFNHMKKNPCAFIRTDNNLVSPGVNLNKHKKDIAFIRKHSGLPIKLCGNVDLDIIRKTFGKIGRYDVNMKQATEIVKTLEREKRSKYLESSEKRRQELVKNGDKKK